MMAIASTAARRAAQALFRTQDLDEARERVAAIFCPHRLGVSDRGRSMRATTMCRASGCH